MSELSVGTLSGLAANSYVIDVASGSTLDLSNATDLPASALPAGSILQVVQAVKTDTFSSASTSFTEITGLQATITPTSATSKILVMTSLSTTNSTSNNGAQFRLTRNSLVDILKGGSDGGRVVCSFGNVAVNSNHDIRLMSMNYLDSPNTTSATTYEIKMRMVAASTGYVNRSGADSNSGDFARPASTITLMEVAV